MKFLAHQMEKRLRREDLYPFVLGQPNQVPIPADNAASFPLDGAFEIAVVRWILGNGPPKATRCCEHFGFPRPLTSPGNNIVKAVLLWPVSPTNLHADFKR